MNHPTPWTVKYYQRFEEWHPQCSPYIVDAEGKMVLDMPQTVGHPGEFDPVAYENAHRIVAAINGHPMNIDQRVKVLTYDEWGTVVGVREDSLGVRIDVRLDSDGSIHVCRTYELKSKDTE